jgi:N-hydroxyarylamine O-acetyltransferase
MRRPRPLAPSRPHTSPRTGEVQASTPRPDVPPSGYDRRRVQIGGAASCGCLEGSRGRGVKNPMKDWTDRYLALLEVPRGEPSVDHLTALTRSHVLRVPFENVTTLLRRRDHPRGPVPQPDRASLLASWETRSGGGLCFEAAMMFKRLLSALGYRARLVAGHISVPFGHQAIVVELGSARYLVDIGNGAPIFAPQCLDDGPTEVHHAGLAFRFRPADESDTLFQDRMIDGNWTPYCRYNLRPAAAADLDAGYQHHHVPNASWVTGTLTIVCSTDDAVYSLRDTTLTRHTASAKSTETLTDEVSYRTVVADVFGLPGLRIADALATRAAFARQGDSAVVG